MLFLRSSRFEKEYTRLSKELKIKANERLQVFVADQFDPILNNHKLGHEFEGYRSINVTGDWRIVYKRVDEQTCLLHIVGTHHQLFRS